MDISECSKEKQQEIISKFEYWYRGDKAAVSMAVDLFFVAHLWDDLVDRDKNRSNADINRAFILALGDLPINPHYANIYPMLRNTMSLWECSNDLYAGNDDEKFMAFLIRNAMLEIMFFLILLTGGPDWLRQVGTDFWRYFGQGMLAEYHKYLNEDRTNG